MIQIEEKEIRHALYLLILISTGIRVLLAATLEFSVDEVYYWTYALYPDWSHFDHPPMVGLVIQFFSLNLLFESELAIRLGAIVLSIFNTMTIFSIGKELKGSLTGLYAAFLLNASIYCSVLAGTFIIPDTPQLFFWLISIKFLLKALPGKTINRQMRYQFLFACLCAGFSILSKYHGVFILAGFGLYVLLFDRKWLREPVFYVGVLLSAIFLLPIVIWNIQNDWISFTFHGDRVTNNLILRPDYFFTEFFGQIAYNNPVNYTVILISLVAIARKKVTLPKDHLNILLLNFAPIWIVFTSFSLFRQTLPHWTGPAFTPLILIGAYYLSSVVPGTKKSKRLVLFPKVLRSAVFLLLFLLIAAWSLINFYPGTIGKKAPVSKYGDTDFTLDMYGWRQISRAFSEIVKQDLAAGDMPLDAPMVSPKYFPGTEIDYYLARPLGKKMFQLGPLNEIHKYAWINNDRGGLSKGSDVYMISTSNWYKDPNDYYKEYFDIILATDTIKVFRSGKLSYYAFVYQLKGYNGNYPDPLNNK